MKHDQLCAIGHNLADSLASGLCFVIGYRDTDVFGEAAASEDGVIEVDFLKGTIVQGRASDGLKDAAREYSEALPDFCRRNGAEAADFTSLTATFDATPTERRAIVTVVDREGHGSQITYYGIPLKRPKVLDPLGRVRRAGRVSLHP